MGKYTRKKELQVPTADDIQDAIDATPNSITGCRNRALLTVLANSGLRVAEALNLQMRDINLRTGMVLVRKGKGTKRREVVLFDCDRYLGEWISAREGLDLPDTAPIFCAVRKGHRGERMSTQNVHQMLERLERDAALDIHLHAHGLRHYLACRLARSGVPVEEIAAQLGHEEIQTTERYLDSLGSHVRLASLAQRRLVA